MRFNTDLRVRMGKRDIDRFPSCGGATLTGFEPVLPP